MFHRAWPVAKVLKTACEELGKGTRHCIYLASRLCPGGDPELSERATPDIPSTRQSKDKGPQVIMHIADIFGVRNIDKEYLKCSVLNMFLQDRSMSKDNWLNALPGYFPYAVSLGYCPPGADETFF